LDIADVRVLDVQVSRDGEYVLTIESTLKSARCHQCGQLIRKFHASDEWVTVRHLPILGHRTYVRFRPKRFACAACDGKPTTMQQLSWHVPNSPNTKAYEMHLLLQLVNATIADVSLKECLSYECVSGLIDRRIATHVDWTAYTELDVLGFDEIALKKGHRDYVVIVTARLADGRLALLAVLADRAKDTLAAFLRSMPEALRQTIQTICSDMYATYLLAAQMVLPQVPIVIDRFHVAKLYRAAVDQLRSQELKRLKQALPKAVYQTLKGSLWAFRKNQTELQPDEQALLARLFSLAPTLALAYAFREELTAIFQLQIAKTEAQAKILAWAERVRHSGLHCLDDFLNTLTRWWEQITNYFVNRDSSGFVEGLNNKLKVLKRRCYGIFNLNHLFQRISLDLDGYRLFAAQPFDTTTISGSDHGNS
jgi:transposase